MTAQVDVRSSAGRVFSAILRRFFGRASSILGWVILLTVVGAAIGADWLYPEDPWSLVGQPLLWPGQDPDFLLGTDVLGRDIASGMFHGARVSLVIGIVAAFGSLLIGAVIGAVAGYYGGKLDALLMRFTEIFQAMPSFLFTLVVVTVFGSDIQTIVLAIAGISWTTIARLVRAEFLSLRSREFVESCIVVGMGDAAIIVRQILPNAAAPILVTSTIMVASAILTEAGLSFLGLGDPNLMTWGTMIGLGRDSLRTSWYMAAIPGTAILLTVLALNLVGEGLNDALNPRLARSRGN